MCCTVQTNHNITARPLVAASKNFCRYMLCTFDILHEKLNTQSYYRTRSSYCRSLVFFCTYLPLSLVRCSSCLLRMRNVLWLLRSRQITIGVFTTEVNSVNHSRLFDTGKGIFPDPHKEGVASPRVLSLKHHTYHLKNLKGSATKLERERENDNEVSQQKNSVRRTAERKHPLHAAVIRSLGLETGLNRKWNAPYSCNLRTAEQQQQ
jgi:hypothetical protein